MKKPRFDYNNPETFILALDYMIEHEKCPECLTIINPQVITNDADILVLKVECLNCGLTFEFECGKPVDNSSGQNDLVQFSRWKNSGAEELEKGAYNHPSLIAIDEIKGTGTAKKTVMGVKNGKL